MNLKCVCHVLFDNALKYSAYTALVKDEWTCVKVMTGRIELVR
jgi:hypothetical protein